MSQQPLLQVAVRHVGDLAGAHAGGADRVLLEAGGDRVGLTPDTALAADVLAAAPLPVHIVLRLRDDDSTTGGELQRLVGLAQEWAAAGAAGFVFGFLTPSLDLDVPVLRLLAEQVGRPWTLSRAVDRVLHRDRAFAVARSLPAPEAILSGGAARGVPFGLDDLCDRAAADPWLQQRLLAAGSVRPEDVPWLLRAGVRGVHVGTVVRPGGSAKAWVDADLVRSWRQLLDATAARTRAGASHGTAAPG